ncbi:hypothetical protein KJ903_01980, partial [Patescibacteria group bacterium]|nr:hypothetical protein [Patescibacteria group bacterium]
MKKIIVVLVATVLLLMPAVEVLAGDDSIPTRIKGRIVLQVEGDGEAWYVNPTDAKRYYLGRPADAFVAMRNLSLGISNVDLAKIPTYRSKSTGDTALTNRLKGRILLQVEGNGEAWYVSPVNGERYYLGRPADAFSLMRNLGLGIRNRDLNKVETGSTNTSRTVRTGTANVELSATAETDGVYVSWTQSNRGDDFEYYKVVRSTTNDDPTYSNDGYIKASSNIKELTYTDSEAVGGQSYYYRICVLYTDESEDSGDSPAECSSSTR